METENRWTPQRVREFFKALRDAKSADEAHDLLVSDAAEEVEVAVGSMEYTYAHLEAGAVMWEHVLHQLHKYRLHGRTGRAWSEYAYAYGMAGLREKVLLHAPTLETEYQQAVANGYAKDFDRDYVPKYMEDHVARVLT